MFDSSFFVAISFLIFVGLVIYMGLPRIIISALDKRSEDIQKELDEARNLREEAQKILAKEKKNLDKAEEESKNLIEKTKQQVDEMTKKAEEILKEDIARKKKIAFFTPNMMEGSKYYFGWPAPTRNGAGRGFA